MKKNLNPNSKRPFIENQIKMLKKELAEDVVLYKNDLLELLKSYEEELHLNEAAKNTKKAYIRYAKYFIENYSTLSQPISKDDVLRFKDELLKKKYEMSTINLYIVSVNRFLHFCDLGIYTVQKVKGQGDNTIPDRIYEQEYKRLIRKAKALNMMDLYYAIRIMAETGVRVEEIKFFTADSIKKESVKVLNKGKLRSVPVSPDLRASLRNYVRDQNIVDEVVKLKYQEIYKGGKYLASICKINKNKIHPHAFRHYFGFRWIEVHSGSSLTQLADIYGHSSLSTTQRYLRGTVHDYLKKVEEL